MKKNIVLVGIGLLLLFLLGIGVSYSMWNMTNTQEKNNVIASSECFDVTITNQENSINLQNTYPISNEKGRQLTPFSFSITNTCDIFASYTVNLESLKNSTLSSRFLDVMINNEEVKRLNEYEETETVNSGSIESYTLAKGSLGSGDSDDYTLRLWIDYDTTMEDLDNEIKIFKSKVVIKSQPSSWNPVNEGYTTLHDAILANEYQSSPEVAMKKIEAKGTPDFSKIAPIIKWLQLKGSVEKTTARKINTTIIGKSEYKAENLTLNDYNLLLGSSYTFNEDNGKYTLANTAYYDINSLDFSSSVYYFCDAGVQFSSDNVPRTYDGTLCNTIYKVISITSSTNSNNNIQDYFINYEIYGEKLYGVEAEIDTSDKGLYFDNDEFGKTYYYRGNINNNNVYFAGYYWKIIRINGDGSVRLLYNGKIKNDSNQVIGNSAFNANYDNPAYAGYMYGSSIGSRENNIKNEVNSTIKDYLDSWYENNISKTNYDNYISDSGFCNDRSIYSGDGNSTTDSTAFGSAKRYSNSSPQFSCPDNNDLFTKSTNSIGNKALKYSIGLITNDELIFAGSANGYINKANYTYSSLHYWTMSPNRFSPYHNSVLGYFPRGGAGYIDADRINYNFSVRPVISLKGNVTISGGIGTVNEPFIVE